MITISVLYKTSVRLVFLLAIAYTHTASMASEAADGMTLNVARETGRKSSRFLKERQRDGAPADTIPTADTDHFQESISGVLSKSCLACHGPDQSEGGLRVDELNPDLLSGADVDRWRAIYNVLSNSEMPPDDEPDFAMSDADRRNIVDWLSEEINKASIVRRGEAEHSSFRRMTSYEYNYALQDLLGLPWYSFTDSLPPETISEDGFRNSSELLQISASQFQEYRKISLKALRRAVAIGDRPEPVTYLISMQDEMDKLLSAKNAKPFSNEEDSYAKNRRRIHLLNPETGQGIQFASGKANPVADAGRTSPASSPVVLEIPPNQELKLNLDRFLPDEGIMRVRLRANRAPSELPGDASVQLKFSAHTSNNANFSNVISERDIPVRASAENPEFIDFHISLSDIQRNPFRKLKTTFPRRDEFLHIRNVSLTGGLYIHVNSIEITAPFYDEWPPKSHTDIFFDDDGQDDERQYGRKVISRFVRRAWRRSPAAAEVDGLMALFDAHRSEFDSFEAAMLQVLSTVLVHPNFLYLSGHGNGKDKPSKINDHEFASRLSAFLWSSIPDEPLLRLADARQLREPKVLNAQIERMLTDQRASRFSKHFVHQWLGLDGLNNVSHIKDEVLRQAMQDEPVAMFDEVLKHNSSVMDFIHSDYAVANERLARHYGIRDVYGVDFRKVMIDPNRNRGGLLTGAAILAMNSDGKDSNPLKRGVWMLERVLHDPPPPPPPDVPEVDLTDPRILEMSLKERILDHRNKPACASCHSRIDPWGIAFENYDAMGAFRTRIGKKEVDATSELFNKQKLEGMLGLKRYLLLDRQDQFAQAMVHKLTAYALGRPLSFGDHAALEEITWEFRQRGDGLRDLIHLIVTSKMFESN